MSTKILADLSKHSKIVALLSNIHKIIFLEIRCRIKLGNTFQRNIILCVRLGSASANVTCYHLSLQCIELDFPYFFLYKSAYS